MRPPGTAISSIPRVDVLGVHISATTLDGAVHQIADWIAAGERTYVCVTGAHGVIESQTDADLLDIHNASGLTTTDGMPLVWAARRAGVEGTERVYGPDLMLALCEASRQAGWRHYFYGGADGVADELAETMAERFDVTSAGTHCPPFRELTADEDDEIVESINASGADIVWVGLSTPKQERWMSTHRDRLDAAVLIGVGAAFDFHTDRVRQAPGWVQRSGLEWAFRLASEPRRLWRRYARIVPSFAWQISRRPPTLVNDSPT